MPNYLVSIVGPTAIGKTALSIKLAKIYSTEIISADSRQFYKEMHIGTAAPTQSELKAAKHHFIHHKSIEDSYSVGDFEQEAIDKLNQLFKSKNTVIMVGGSGLYLDAVTKGLDYFPKIKPGIRDELNQQLSTKGLQHLTLQLKKLDPVTFESIDLNNPHRVIRALEVCLSSGKAYSTFLRSKNKKRNFQVISIGLMAERPIIYKRINRRVEQMIKDGLLNEVKNLQSKMHLNALNTVGYKELVKYLNGDWELDFAISEIKKNTRRFAKRQITWFKRNEKTIWFDLEANIKKITQQIELEKRKTK